MTNDVRDLVFLDTETVGLHPDAPIWEFSATRVVKGVGAKTSVTMLVQHDPGDHLLTLDEKFKKDYLARYNAELAIESGAAAATMASITTEAIVIGCNPDFDIRRIESLLVGHNIEPTYHYHPFDIASVAFGYLAGKGKLMPQPWKSDILAEAVGVMTADFARHTAEGDVDWTRAQWNIIVG